MITKLFKFNKKYFCDILKVSYLQKRVEYWNVINKKNLKIEEFKIKNYNLNEIFKGLNDDNKILSIFILIKNINKIKLDLKPVQFFNFIRSLETELFKNFDNLLFEENLFLLSNLGKYNYIDKNIFSKIESNLLEFKDEIVSKNYEAPKLIYKIWKNFILNDNAKSEFLYDVIEWIRLMEVENMVQFKDLLKIVNILSKSSSNMKNFFGLKKVLNSYIKMNHLKFGLDEIFMIIKYSHEIRALNTENFDILEKRAIYLLRHNEKIETYKLNINILKSNYDVDDKILFQLKRFIECFIALHNRYHKRSQLLDKIQGISLKYIEGLTNNYFIKLFISFFNNFYNNKELEDLFIKELKIRIKGLSLRDLIFSFNKYSFLGIKDIEMVRDYFITLNNKFEDLNNFHYLLKSLETLIQLQFYFYPEELITKEEDKKLIFNEIRDLVNKNIKLSLNKIKEKIENFTILNKISDIPKIIKILYGLKNLIITEKFDNEILDIFNNSTKIILNNSEVLDYYVKMNNIKQLENLDLNDNRNNYNFLDLNQISEIFIIYSEIGFNDLDFMNKLVFYWENNINTINKDYFSGVYKNVQNYKKLKKRNDFVEIIIELQKYGDFKYFFKHSQYIKLMSGIIFNFFYKYFKFLNKDNFSMNIYLSKKFIYSDLDNMKNIINNFMNQNFVEINENLLLINFNNLNGIEIKLLNDLIIFIQYFVNYKYINDLIQRIKNIDLLLNYELLYKLNLSLRNKIEDKEFIKKEIENSIMNLDAKEYFLDYNFTDDFLNILDVVLIMELNSGKMLKLGFIILNDDAFINNELKLEIGLNLFNWNYILKWDLLIINDKEFKNNKHLIKGKIKEIIKLNLIENKFIN